MLSMKRKYSHTAWRIASAGKGWCLNEIGFTNIPISAPKHAKLEAFYI